MRVADTHRCTLRHTLQQLARPLALTHGTRGIFRSPKDPPNWLKVGFYSHTLFACAFISSLLYLARYAGPDHAASSCVLPTHTAAHRTVTNSRAAERLATVTGVRRVHEMKWEGVFPQERRRRRRARPEKRRPHARRGRAFACVRAHKRLEPHRRPSRVVPRAPRASLCVPRPRFKMRKREDNRFLSSSLHSLAHFLVSLLLFGATRTDDAPCSSSCHQNDPRRRTRRRRSCRSLLVRTCVSVGRRVDRRR